MRGRRKCEICGSAKPAECDQVIHAADRIATEEEQAAAMDEAGEEQAAPLFAGTFAVYQTKKGALVLVTEIPGRGVERKVFPAAMIKLAMSGPLKGMLGMGG